MSEIARAKVLEDVLLERERQDTTWDDTLYGYSELIRLAAVCFAWAEAYREGQQTYEEYS